VFTLPGLDWSFPTDIGSLPAATTHTGEEISNLQHTVLESGQGISLTSANAKQWCLTCTSIADGFRALPAVSGRLAGFSRGRNRPRIIRFRTLLTLFNEESSF
jgi:hypothetical protein